MEKLAQTPDNDVPLPESIQPHINTTLAWDNIDRLEETLSGAGTSHRVNGIAVQERHFGPFPKPKANMEISKTKRRSIDYLPRTEVMPYNAGERHGPPSRAYIEVTSTVILEEARKKNLLWVLVRPTQNRSKVQVAGQALTFSCVMRSMYHRIA